MTTDFIHILLEVKTTINFFHHSLHRLGWLCHSYGFDWEGWSYNGFRGHLLVLTGVVPNWYQKRGSGDFFNVRTNKWNDCAVCWWAYGKNCLYSSSLNYATSWSQVEFHTGKREIPILQTKCKKKAPFLFSQIKINLYGNGQMCSCEHRITFFSIAFAWPKEITTCKFRKFVTYIGVHRSRLWFPHLQCIQWQVSISFFWKEERTSSVSFPVS